MGNKKSAPDEPKVPFRSPPLAQVDDTPTERRFNLSEDIPMVEVTPVERDAPSRKPRQPTAAAQDKHPAGQGTKPTAPTASARGDAGLSSLKLENTSLDTHGQVCPVQEQSAQSKQHCTPGKNIKSSPSSSDVLPYDHSSMPIKTPRRSSKKLQHHELFSRTPSENVAQGLPRYNGMFPPAEDTEFAPGSPRPRVYNPVVVIPHVESVLTLDKRSRTQAARLASLPITGARKVRAGGETDAGLARRSAPSRCVEPAALHDRAARHEDQARQADASAETAAQPSSDKNSGQAQPAPASPRPKWREEQPRDIPFPGHARQASQFIGQQHLPLQLAWPSAGNLRKLGDGTFTAPDPSGRPGPDVALVPGLIPGPDAALVPGREPRTENPESEQESDEITESVYYDDLQFHLEL